MGALRVPQLPTVTRPPPSGILPPPQVKQLPTVTRLKIAESLLLVDEWQRTGGSSALIATAQEVMAGFGVTFLPGSPPEVGALALFC
jgi:hypothetical protein